MWISLNNAFLSIVQPPNDPAHLLVRARRPGDLQAVFPACQVVQLEGRDYQFRTTLPREQVAAVVAQAVLGISYGNFKGSVKDNRLHDAYASVWSVMSKLQPRPPYGRKAPARRARGHPFTFRGCAVSGAVLSQAEMVKELMDGLKIPNCTLFPHRTDLPREWRLTDDDVVRLAQVCVRQVTSMKADPGAAPLALQAAVTRNAWALVDALHFAGKSATELPALCPHAADDPLAQIWHTAVASRLRWIEGGRLVS